ANGVGKSTLLRVLAGLSPVSQGSVTWNGFDRIALPSTGAPVAYVGHQSGLYTNLSVGRYLERLIALNPHTNTAADKLPGLLEASGLKGLEQQLCAALSAGQKKRLALVRCVLLDYPVWLLDEPFSSLDTAGQQWLKGALERHCDAGGLLVYTDHQAVFHSTACLDLSDHTKIDADVFSLEAWDVSL
ncbi:MAG: heme ABC exporter ATP-binding protein CcmA, partial [Pseudomonadota bacterium]